MSRVDLHMHSTASDGSLSVQALVRAVHAAGVAAFALTDHDTVAGLDEAGEEARRLGLRLVNGVEISTRLDGVEVHMLGYGFDPEHPGLRAALTSQQAAREARLPRMIDRLRALGLEIAMEDVLREVGDGSPGRPHVAKALVRRGVCQNVDEAFERYLGDRGPAQVEKQVPEPKHAIRWIHEAGGKAVWAHPLARAVQRPFGFEGMARELAQHGLDGLEEIHPAQGRGARRKVRRVALELGLALSGGSDFHGTSMPDVALGVGRGDDEVSAAVLDTLLSR